MLNIRYHVFFALFAAVALQADPDRILTPRLNFYAATVKGLSGAGCAMPWTIASALENPALLYASWTYGVKIAWSLSPGFGRDSLFDNYCAPLSAGIRSRRIAYALSGRALSSSAGFNGYEAAITVCRRFWGLSEPEGPLDMGISIRYEYSDWNRTALDTFITTQSYLTPSGKKIRPDSLLGRSIPPELQYLKENRVLFDIGVYKPEIADHVDVGLSIKTPFGYAWRIERPDTVRLSDTVGIIDDSISVIRTGPSWRDRERAFSGRIPLRYTTITTGFTYRLNIPASGILLSIPTDCSLYGLFDKSIKTALAINTGIQMHFRKNMFIRAGYSYAPPRTPAPIGDIKLVHDVAFGASMVLPSLPVLMDFYFSNYAWGVTMTVE